VKRKTVLLAAAAVVLIVVVINVVLFGGAGPVLPLLVLGAMAAGIWFFLFSGRVRTATKEGRTKIWHRLFLAFFTFYVFGLLAWLAAGLLPAIAHHVPSLHDRLHAYGGVSNVIDVSADEIAPFSVDGSQRIREMTMREGSTVVINFTNSPTYEDLVYPHNVAIGTTGGETIFRGPDLLPKPGDGFDDYGSEEEEDFFDANTTIYAFTAPSAGSYVYFCSIHPDRMRGSVLVLEPDAHTSDWLDPGFRDMARRVAEVSHEAQGVSDVTLDYIFSALSLGLGIFLVALRPRERMARIFGLAMVGTAAAYNLQSHASLAVHSAFEDPLHFFLHPLTGVMYIYALVLFPDGRLIPRWSNRIVRVAYRAAVFFTILFLLGSTGGALPDFGQHPAALVLVFGFIIPILGIAAQSFRLRRASGAETRQQSRLLLWATVASLGVGAVLLLVLNIDLKALIEPTVGDPIAIGENERLAFRVFQPLFVVIPIALFAGILRYRLWDIDLVVNRTLVYGALAGSIGALYVGIVVGLGGALGGRTELTIVATVLGAVAFDPLRSRFQSLANRLVYGQRSSPYEVMAGVSQRLAGAATPEDVLPVVAETAARAVGAARTRARLTLPSGEVREATWPGPSEETTFDRVIPVTHLGEEIGEIAVAKRAGDALKPAENRLLEALAGHAGLAIQSVRLAEELRARLADLELAAGELAASRGRLMRAADAERVRLEKLIHEGVEQELVAMSEQLTDAERAFGRSRARSVSMLERIAEQANHTQETLRDLARGIYPPLLSDRGVVPALESQVRKLPGAITMSGTIAERFDPRSEAAVYFCCVEALRRAAVPGDHAAVTIELGRENGWVRFAVRGSGPALTTDLQLLIDRVEAVGGSLEVRGSNGEGELAGRVPAQVAAAQTPASRSGSNADLGT
jgi:signal transduction histidine kinase/plastocyanin